NSYKSGRGCLLAVTALTLVNMILMLIDSNVSFIYSAAVPQIAIVLAKAFFTGMQRVFVIVIFALIPVALLAISYLLSKKDWKWLLVGTVLMSIDIICLAVFAFINGTFGDLLINFVFEFVILFTMIKGVSAGKKLNNDFSEPNQNDVIRENTDQNVKVYFYDKNLARENKTNKVLPFLALTLGFMFLEFGVVVACAFFYNSDNAVYVTILTLIGALAVITVYILLSIKLTPFVSASSYSFYKENDCIYRISSASMITAQAFANVLVEKETSNAYYCSYISQNGKSRKLIIPKCYPQIDEILY
ncbi:MAG: hypothetical protein Q4C64_05570, partial [Erysipelotrichia bacterium]|nr:hypothetical protein [Erysipelotrichia bacterium]